MDLNGILSVGHLKYIVSFQFPQQWQTQNPMGHVLKYPRQKAYDLRRLQPADVISFHRRYASSGSMGFWHYAIVNYVDIDDNIISLIHFQSGGTSDWMSVVETTLRMDEGPVWLVELLESDCVPAKKVLKRAWSKIDDEVPYHILQNNCEHFAMWCKTGQDRQIMQSKSHTNK